MGCFRTRCSCLIMVPIICLLVLPSLAAGRVVNVATTADMQNAVRNAWSGDEIIIAPGTYQPTVYLTISANNVTVRGATGDPADVVIRGAGMNVNPGNGPREGFALYADDITIRDLTVAEYYYHAIHFGVGADRMHIDNVVTRNNGQQHIKGAKPNVGGIIENTLCEQTYVRTNEPNDPRGYDYVGGIDLHGGRDFIIRDTMVRNIMGAGGDADGSIFAWNESANVTVERCIVIGGNRGICFGNNSGGRYGYDVDGGIIRNCFVYARTGATPDPNQPWLGDADIGIDLAFVRNVKVYHNTIWTNSDGYGRTVQFYDSWSLPNVNLDLSRNIIRGNIRDWTGGRYTASDNITGGTARANWFVDAANADFHLTRNAVGAIDQVAALADVPTDIDGHPRPLGLAADIGADELLAGDINGDNSVDAIDLLTLATAFNTSVGHPDYNLSADLNSDGIINAIDLLILARCWQL